LNSIVGQVHKFVVQIVVGVFLRRRAQVAFSEKVDLRVLVDAHPRANVELALIH
jgi:hypothetical protein